MLALCAANAAYLAGLESAVPGGAVLVAGTGGPLVQMLRRADHVATTIDEHPDMLRATDGSALSAGVVLGAAPIVELIEERGVDAVLPFKSGPRLWRMADFQGLRVLASPDKLTRQLENKLALAEIADAADARIPDTVNIRLDAELAAAAANDGIALPRVYQPAVGFAGAGTVLLRTAEDVAALVAQAPASGGAGKLVEFVDGEPVTVNGVVIPPDTHGAGSEGEVLVGMVARQLTGLAGLTPTDFGSCGNDWSKPPPREAVVAVRSLAHRIGEVLAQRGFAGAFGIDVMLPTGGGVPVLIEINPRWTASLALQVELQQAQGMPTLLDAHLAAFAWRSDERTTLPELLAAYGPGEDAGCTRSTSPVATVIAYNATDAPIHVNPEFEPGVWRVGGEDEAPTVERLRDGWRIGDLRADDEVLIIPAGTARPLAPGAYLVRVVQRGTAASDGRARSLRPAVRALMDEVVSRVTL
ncbi:MAG: acetyl-CoA carboxylase [Thermoleophilia bacterium]|nr:acetyl-CoA carboxylase [Thermoleophilia bacterium]MCZ4497057.1 acetyl-CoA carboxylase [Thermoleophilia bacterium]